MGGSSHLQKEIFPNNALSVLNENIRFSSFWHIMHLNRKKKKSIYSSFVCPVDDCPGSADESTQSTSSQQFSHITFVKSFLLPQNLFAHIRFPCVLCKSCHLLPLCFMESLQRKPQICSPSYSQIRYMDIHHHARNLSTINNSSPYYTRDCLKFSYF